MDSLSIYNIKVIKNIILEYKENLEIIEKFKECVEDINNINYDLAPDFPNLSIRDYHITYNYMGGDYDKVLFVSNLLEYKEYFL